MFQKLAILSGLIISASCLVYHPLPVPLLYGLPQDDSRYNFAYEVNDFNTGDIKSQHETRVGGTVHGQYILVQPDGVIRNVEYKADDLNGFQATVNNIGTPISQLDVQNLNAPLNDNVGAPQNAAKTQTTPEPEGYKEQSVTPAPVESRISTSSTVPMRSQQPWN